MQLSLVIPVFNEEASLKPLFEEIDAVLTKEGYQAEIIFVDDGSNDGSWQIIAELAQRDARVRGIRFRRNFGKAAALNAGFSAARGQRVITLDADLQDNPAEIPRFLAKIDEGVDVVSGWKKVRHDPWHKVYPSRVFNWMVSRMTGVRLHDHNCGMKCYRGEVLGEVFLYGELHRFIPVLAAARGFRVDELVIQHRPREHGKSKYGITRFIKGFLDLLSVKFVTGFGQRPQHVLGTMGLVCFALGAILLTFLAGQWTISRLTPMPDVELHERPLVIYATALLLMGGQFISVGFLAELFTAFHVPRTKTYSVAEELNVPPEDLLDA